MNEFTAVDLFSGIAGFTVAGTAAGFRTVAFVERDERCQAFLKSAWPNIPVHPDIKNFDGKPYRGANIVWGGPPCQPASRAGKQGGDGDDRWLWPEALRVLGEVQPDCVVFENPPGIIDVGLDGILAEMARLGYETQCFDIPACAVDSPQLRHRIWIVGFMAHSRLRTDGTKQPEPLQECHSRIGQPACGDAAEPRYQRANTERGSNGRAAERAESELAVTDQDRRSAGRDAAATTRHGHSAESEVGAVLADTSSTLHGKHSTQQKRGAEVQGFNASNVADVRQGNGNERPASAGENGGASRQGERPDSQWQNYVWLPCADGKVRRAPDDSFSLVDGLHRSLLGALGNSICPQVAFQILQPIADLLRKEIE